MPSNDRRSRNVARESNRHCIITMVHGTWDGARPSSWRQALFRAADPDPPWYHEGSVFRSRLESELRKENIVATLRPFQWSGANTVRDRARAADELSKQLVASDSDKANSIVIAHSHGGNVALRAISKLGSRGASIHLITLATPFVRVFPNWEGPGFWEVFFPSLITIAIGAVLLLLGTAPRDWVEGYGLLVVLVISAVLSTVLVGRVINPSPRPTKRQLDAWAGRPFALADDTNYDSVSPQAPNLLVIRGVDDEAALILASGSIATAISRFVLGAMRKWLYPLLGLLCVPMIGYYWLAPSGFRRWIEVIYLRETVVIGMLVLKVGRFFCLLVPGLLNSRFGREFLMGATRCEIAAESAPDSTGVQIVTLKTPYQLLPPLRSFHELFSAQSSTSTTLSMRHRIYNYPDCVPAIVKWINEHAR